MLKTAELTGPALDYWVAKAEGMELWGDAWDDANRCTVCGVEDWSPSTDWAQCGPLIEKYNLNISACVGGNEWTAFSNGLYPIEYGDTLLVAICRVVVRSVFGDEVDEVPAK